MANGANWRPAKREPNQLTRRRWLLSLAIWQHKCLCQCRCCTASVSNAKAIGIGQGGFSNQFSRHPSHSKDHPTCHFPSSWGDLFWSSLRLLFSTKHFSPLSALLAVFVRENSKRHGHKSVGESQYKLVTRNYITL